MGALIQPNLNKPLQLTIEDGWTMQRIIDESQVPESLLQFVVITVNGTQLAPDQWDNFIPRQNDRVGFWVRPAGGDGGKQILRLVALVAVAIAAPVIAGQLGSVAGFATTTAAGTLTTAGLAVAAGVAVVGSLLINALIPPPSLNAPSGAGLDQGQSYFITSQSNSARPYQLVPIVYGSTKMVANLASAPQIFSAGQSSIFTALYDFGLGTLEIGDIKAGDTRIEVFNGDIVEHAGFPKLLDPSRPSAGLDVVPLELVNYPINSEDLNIALNLDGQQGIVGTTAGAVSAVVEIFFPQGVAYFDKNGNLQNLGVTFRGEYRPIGQERWLPWPPTTVGYAKDHLSLQVSAADPNIINPNSPPSIRIFVPKLVATGDTFEIRVLFGQEVWGFDAAQDLSFIRANTGEPVNDAIKIIAQSETTAGREWTVFCKAASNLAGSFFVRTDLKNVNDASGSAGKPFPEYPYTSPSFVVGQYVTQPPNEEDGAPNTGGGGGDGGVDTGDSIDIYNNEAGNETYVRVKFKSIVPMPEPFGPENPEWVFWFEEVAQYFGFEIYLNGDVVRRNTGNWEDYAGVVRSWGQSPLSEGYLVTLYYTFKVSDQTGIGRSIESGLNRFFPTLPNWEPTANFTSTFSVFGNETTAGRVSVVVTFPEEGQYELRVTRVGDTEDRDDNNQYFNSAYWTRLATRGYPIRETEDGPANDRRSVINLKRQHTLLEMSIEANETLQGNVQSISAVVISKLRWHDGEQWQPPRKTSNPAWIVADLLTGYSAQQNRYPYGLQDDAGYMKLRQLDIQSFIDFADVCDEEVEYEYQGETLTRRRYEFNSVVASEATMFETVQNVLGMARAQLILGQNGLMQIMQDVDRGDQVRQLFTPANSWGFSAERTFPSMPDALAIEFVSPELGYNLGEVIVYRPDVDPEEATTFETLKTYGCTNWHQAAWWGGYQMAQMLIRMETFTLNVMAESLVIQRGDVVEIATDVAKVGGGAHLIVDHPAPDKIVLSELPYVYDDPYYTIRTNSGIVQGKVLATDEYTITLDKPIDQTIYASETAICVIGQKDLVTKKYIVNSIRPKADLSAELTLVVYDERMYQTDDGIYPEWDAGGDGNPEDPNYGKYEIRDLEGSNYLEFEGEGYCKDPVSISLLRWDVTPDDGKVAQFEIQWQRAGQTAVVGTDIVGGSTREYIHRYAANGLEFGSGLYTVTPVTQLGYKGLPKSVYVNQSYDRIAPPRPTSFKAVQLTDQIRFYWNRPSAIDIGGYAIYVSRFRANDGNLPEGADLVTNAGCKDEFIYVAGGWDQIITPIDSIYELGAVFYITCIDTSGNESKPAIYDGLRNGPYPPALVEPFDMKYSEGGLGKAGYWGEDEYNGGAEYGSDGASQVMFLVWEDLDDPYNEILYYDIRHTPEENAPNLYGDAANVHVQLETVPQGEGVLNLTALGMSDYSGTYFIRAVDKNMRGGPWNRTGTQEMNVTISDGVIEQVIGYYPFDRSPYSDITVSWTAAGSDLIDVKRYMVYLYPQQQLPARSATLLYDGTDTECTFSLPHLTEQELHYGIITVEARFDNDYSGDPDAIASNVLVIPWQLEYDVEGPPAPTDVVAIGGEGT